MTFIFNHSAAITYGTDMSFKACPMPPSLFSFELRGQRTQQKLKQCHTKQITNFAKLPGLQFVNLFKIMLTLFSCGMIKLGNIFYLGMNDFTMTGGFS